MSAVGEHSVDDSATGPQPLDAQEAERSRGSPGRQVPLDCQAQWLSDDHAQGGCQDRERQPRPTIAPSFVLGPQGGEESRDPGKGPRRDKAGSAVGVDGQAMLACAQAGQSLDDGLFDCLRWHIAVEVEALRVRSAHQERSRVASGQKMNGGMLQAMVASDSGELRRVQDVLEQAGHA